MVFDASLGYDPDEWEECTEIEHFMVFSFFTRIMLSTIAIGFAYCFFQLVDKNKNKGNRENDEAQESAQTWVETVGHVVGVVQKTVQEYTAPKKTEELLQTTAQAMQSGLSEAKREVKQAADHANVLEKGKTAVEDMYEKVKEEVQQHYVLPGEGQGSRESTQYPSLHRRKDRRSGSRDSQKPLTGDEQRALQQWELDKQVLEVERLNKIKDVEVGGEESSLSSGSRVFEQLAPASHISYHSSSPPEDNFLLEPLRGGNLEETPILEKKLRSDITQLAAHEGPGNRESFRESELTDFDISDYPAHEVYDASGSRPTADLRFVLGQESEEKPRAVIGQRRTTGDSDEYVKIQEEPVYDFPPRSVKGISPAEEKQLQELYQEYDFGSDFAGKPQHVAPKPVETTTTIQIGHHPVEIQSKSPLAPFQIAGIQGSDPVPKKVQMNIQTKVLTEGQRQGGHPQDQGGHQQPPTHAAGASGFVMEEEMLSSQASRKLQHQHRLPSGDPTSQMIKTGDVFERVEMEEHDDMTYAPEIQSVEIPPDQMSENSENLVEYFDRVAEEAEKGTSKLLQQKLQQQQSQPKAAPPMAGGSLGSIPELDAFHAATSPGKALSNTSLASGRSGQSQSGFSSDGYPRLRKQSSLLSVLGVTSMQEMLLTIDSLDTLSDAMRKAGLDNTNLIFGIDYTASNKYQGEESFGGRSLHTIHPSIKNPYQQVITILGRTLAPFASTGRMPVFGFGDAKTGDWSVFPLNPYGDCKELDDVIKVYNEITPTIELSGPTNFAPLIYQAMETCQKAADYHILVIIADGQVTNERATRKAIVQACQYPLSIIVVGVGDGPWDMMRVFDESLPKRPWDNFHFVEFHELMKKSAGLAEGDVKLAVQSLLEIPDQYRCICELGLLRNRLPPPRRSEHRKDVKRH